MERRMKEPRSTMLVTSSGMRVAMSNGNVRGERSDGTW